VDSSSVIERFPSFWHDLKRSWTVCSKISVKKEDVNLMLSDQILVTEFWINSILKSAMFLVLMKITVKE
jgi:hypothetical protein